MSYRLPPLNGLRAFEAAARHKSFARAADELGVTAGAVSQQVKALEEALGVELFRRLPRAIALTADGRKYLPSISAAFEAISIATEQAAPTLRGRKLRLGIAPAFDKADCPALRRLTSRKDAAPVIGMRGHDDPALLADGSLDAIIRPSIGACAGMHIEHLTLRTESAEPVAAVLVMRPGVSGCRQHRDLVRLLRA